METKLCSSCNETKDLDQFYRNPNGKPGRLGTCKECRRAYQKSYAANNPERVQEIQQRWKESNREYASARYRNYYATNRDRFRAKDRAYREANPHKVKQWTKAQRARKRGSTVCDLTSEQWHSIQEQQHHRCYYCGVEEKLTQDHIVPLSSGGNHTVSNIVGACTSCNTSKGTKPVELWIGTRNSVLWTSSQ